MLWNWRFIASSLLFTVSDYTNRFSVAKIKYRSVFDGTQRGNQFNTQEKLAALGHPGIL